MEKLISFYFLLVRSASEWIGRKGFRLSACVLALCLLLWGFQAQAIAREHAQSAPSLPEPLTPYVDVDVTVPGEKLDLRITRVDLWQQLPDGTEPQHDRFLVLLGALVGRESTACVGQGAFNLQIGDRLYDVSNRQPVGKRVYGLDYPGGFFGQCASPGEVEPTFLIFDVEDNAGAVQLIFDDRAHDLQLDYAQLQAASVVPDPTATPTPSQTATPTATPTATFTPASVALVASADDEQLPPAAMRHVGVDGRVAEDGLAFDLRRIDVWTEAPGGRQPRNDILLVFVGALTRTDNPAGRSNCLYARELKFQVGDEVYDLSTSFTSNLKDFYAINYPGSFLGRCTNQNSPEATFFAFDVPATVEDAYLLFKKASMRLDVLEEPDVAAVLSGQASEVQAAQGTTATPNPTDTPVVTNTPDTATPRATSTPPNTATFTATPLPTATYTPYPSDVGLEVEVREAQQQATASGGANLRAGPGTGFEVIGGVAAGEALDIVGRNAAGDWYQLANGAWIAAFLVEGAPGNLAVAEIPAAPVVEGVPAATPAVQAQPSGGQAFTCIDGCAEPPDPACAIKGNVNSSGEKIYHSPGGQFYDRTDIKPEEGDRWFCTSEEARQAGFRASQR